MLCYRLMFCCVKENRAKSVVGAEKEIEVYFMTKDGLWYRQPIYSFTHFKYSSYNMQM